MSGVKKYFEDVNRSASIYFREHQQRLGLSYLLPGLALVVAVLGSSLAIIISYSFITPVPPQEGGVEFTLEHYQQLLETTLYFSILWDSFLIALATTAIALIIGYPPAYLLSIMNSKYKNFYLLLLILPFWINVVVRTYAWRLILGSGGLLDWIFVDTLGVVQTDLQLLFSRGAISIGLIHVFLPFMIIPIYVSLASIDRAEIEAAKNLGANQAIAFREITWPQSLPGVSAGVLLVFVMSFGAFVVPSLLGGRGNIMIANTIAEMFGQLQAWGLGSAISVVFIFLLFILVFIFNRKVSLGNVYGIGGETE